MRKILLPLLFVFISFNAFSQMQVKEGSFKYIPSAIMDDKYDHYDGNDLPMSLIKISTENINEQQRLRLIFQSNRATMITKEPKTGQMWIYITSQFADFIEIKHPDYGTCKYYLPERLCDWCVYEMTLQYIPLTPLAQEPAKPKNNFVSIIADQADSFIYIDDEYVGQKEAFKSLSIGSTHTWRIECELYHTESGTLTVVEGDNIIERNMRPAYGYLNITTIPENGALVFINNKQVGETPYKSDKLPSGTYKVRVMKEMFKTTEQTLIVNDEQTTDATIDMSANFVTLTIVTDADSDIYVDEQYKGKGSWTGRVSDGAHLLEARKESHKTNSVEVNLNPGETQTIEIEAPKPICGFLEISSIPMQAEIFIDGKNVGKTPKVLNDLVIGTHELVLKKQGYNDVKKNITIIENETLSITEKLSEADKDKDDDKDKDNDLVVKQHSKSETKQHSKSLTFINANVAYSVAPQLSYGFTIGRVKKVGWYVSAMSNFNFDAMGASLECDEIGRIDGEAAYYTGETTTTRLSVVGGMAFKVAKPLCLKVGLGYGIRQLAWHDNKDHWVKNTGYSTSGLDYNAGVMLMLGGFNISADVVTTDFNYMELKLGIGFSF